MMQVGSVSYDRQPIADHAINLASTIQLNLKRSLEAIGVVSAPAIIMSSSMLLSTRPLPHSCSVAK